MAELVQLLGKNAKGTNTQSLRGFHQTAMMSWLQVHANAQVARAFF